MSGTISESSMVQRVKDQVSCDLGGEAVVLNFKGGVYYGLDVVGAHVWNLIQEPKRVSEIRNSLLEEYEVEPDHCEQDLLRLLQALLAAGLIELQDETPS